MTETKEITLAEYAGFCYGVKRAVDTVKKIKSENPNKNVYVLGELIHNAQVIDELNSFGVISLHRLPKTGQGICVVRSHGESPQTFEDIKNAGFEVYDLTCPDVKKVQQKAVELVKEGYYLVIVGKEEHPEVSAIKANALMLGNKVIVASKLDDIYKYRDKLKEHKNIGVVVQTTQTLKTLSPIIEYLLSISKELKIVNTICPSTSRRQAEAKELALNNDLMIVVGSKNSANTTHLADIAKEFTKTIHIETSDELSEYEDLINSSSKIAVTAGASTPQNVINDVVNMLK